MDERWDVSKSAQLLISYALAERQAAEKKFTDMLNQAALDDGVPPSEKLAIDLDELQWYLDAGTEKSE